MSSVPPKKQKYNEQTNDYFPDIKKISFNPNAGPEDVLSFKHYNASEVVMGRSMTEWLRFSVCFWHTFTGTGLDPFGSATIFRPWEVAGDAMATAERRLRAAFEFFSKLGVEYWTFHDRDLAPEGSTLAETNANLDRLVALAAELQQKTGVKLLWATCNLFANKRYLHGAATSPDLHVTAYAGAQLKKGLDVAKRLGAENFVFWGGREGYHSLLNTDVKQELDHLAAFLRMAVEYKKKIGFPGILLIEPKAREPTRHQYDFDAQTVMAFLHQYALSDHFKLNIEPNHTMLSGHPYEHDIIMASIYGMLGSVDANTGSPDLGWDTDQFPMDIRNSTVVMKTIIEQGGLHSGGLNFDAKVRRESTDLADMFIAHIGAMDCLARGLKNAASIVRDGILKKKVEARYSSWQSGLGVKLASSLASLEDCQSFIEQNGNPNPGSAHQESYEAILNRYI